MASATTNKKTFGNRKFYALPDDYALRAAKPRASTGVKKPEDTAKLLKYIDDNVIGKNATFAGPFGRRKVVYCDYTASGRSLQFLEDYILKEVLPSYGNTHTTTSITSLQSTLYRHEARDIFRNAVNASEHDAVIFAGHGCTGAVHKLLNALHLAAPPVVFVGPCEHHSNLLPWRETGATIVRVGESRDGQLDAAELEAGLQTYHGSGRQLIGCFTAASNVTGILADDVATTVLLHRYGALAFWDYAAAAPYVKIDMNPSGAVPGAADGWAAKDAVFFSVHKFVGGVQTPGVLVAKKSMFRNAVPNGCGGGSVFFVSRDSHRYLQDTELREEGGTAAVVESVRAGLAMQLKEAVGVAAILSREEKMTRAVLAHCRTIPELVLLGPATGSHKRLPIFSFMVKHPRGTFLHHNFVCMVLNDVFGIQARGGCACAGPYAQDLLGIDAALAQEYEDLLLEDSRLDRTHLRRHEEHSSYEMLRPGFARISLPYFMSDAELAFVLEALKMVATEGWKLLPQYIVNPETGEWRHHTNLTFKERKWLGAVRYVDGKMSVNERRVSGAGTFPPDYAECLRTARGVCNRARKMAQRCPLPDQNVMFGPTAEHLRWFMLPSEAQDLLLGHSQNVKTALPFDPSQPQTPRLLSPRHSHSQTNPPLDSLMTHPPNPPQTQPFDTLHIQPIEVQSQMIDSYGNIVDSTQGHLVDMQQQYIDMQRHSIDLQGLTLGLQGGLIDQQQQFLDTQTHSMDTQVHPLDTQGHSFDTRQSFDVRTHTVDSQGHVFDPQRQFFAAQRHSIDPATHFFNTQRATEPSLDTRPLHLLDTQPTELSRSLSHSPVHFALGAPASALATAPRTLHPPPQRERCYSLGADVTFSAGGDEGGGRTEPAGNRGNNVDAGLSAYVREMTRDIATEIKSEIREVITQVEDVLSETSDSHCGLADAAKGRKGGSVSVSDVMDYLMECSREMASEVKSEIRSAADGLTTPDAERGRLADLARSSDGSSDETVVMGRRSRGKLDPLSTPSRADELDKHRALARPAIASVSSQDSGINLVFPESDAASAAAEDARPRRRKLNLSASTPAMLADSADATDATDGGRGAEPSAEDTRGSRWHCPPKAIWKPAVEALHEFGMVRDGDRVLVCLSGGKDSLSLLHAMHQFQFYARAKGVHFALGAATVDPGSSAYDPRPLIPYLASLGVHYLYEEQPILEQAAALPAACSSVCSFCSRMKRGRLYAAARANGYNVLALGQHLDDLVESFFMSAFHNGRLRSMKAHYLIRERDLRVIRPFVYVREKALRQFAESRNLPVIAENCPACFEAPKERYRSKQLLAQQEVIFPKLFWSLRTALHPLISFRKTGEEALAFSRQHRAARALALAPDLHPSDTDEEEA